MKQNLLSILFILLISSFASAHIGVPLDEGITTFKLSYVDNDGIGDKKINVYPNPATDYFMLKNAEDVGKVVIYNIVGRQMKQFKVNSPSDRFNVNELPKGMYVVRLLDENNEVIQTIRMNKR